MADPGFCWGFTRAWCERIEKERRQEETRRRIPEVVSLVYWVRVKFLSQALSEIFLRLFTLWHVVLNKTAPQGKLNEDWITLKAIFEEIYEIV